MSTKHSGASHRLYPISSDQYELLLRVTNGDERMLVFLAFILQEQGEPALWGTPGDGGDRSFVEIPSETIRRRFKDPDWKPYTHEYANMEKVGGSLNLSLRNETECDVLAPTNIGLLRILNYSTDKGRCRAFSLPNYFLNIYNEAGPSTAAQASRTEWVFPETGRKSGRARTSKTSDDNRHPLPSLVSGAIKVMRKGVFDAVAVEAFLADRKAEIVQLRGVQNKVARDLARRRLAVDLYAYRSVLAQRPRQSQEGTWTYTLCYRVGTSGRLFQLRGGFQSASRAMKAVAFGGAVGACNYDIQASQGWALRQLMEDAGLPCPGITAYLERPYAAELLAIDAEVSTGTVKKAMYALFFGNLVSPERASNTIGMPRVMMNSAVAAILEDSGPDNFQRSYRIFYEFILPVVEDVHVWRRHLAETVVAELPVSPRGNRYLVNATGMKRNMTRRGESGLPYNSRDVGKYAAAHLLQGLESAFIHALTAILGERGILVIANEHDGLVCLGELQPGDISAAQDISGFHFANIVLKPFV